MQMPPAGGGTYGYREFLVSPASSGVLAFVSTIHIALALLRRERAALPAIVFASFLFAAAPWLLPSPAGLLLGIAVHVAWFATCERLAPKLPQLPKAHAIERRPVAPAHAARSGFIETDVLSVFDETPDIRTFRLARPAGFDFRAGQFLTVRVTAASKPVVRCYTISSAPEARGYLEISVKRLGIGSTALHGNVREGTRLAIRGPGGHFLYPDGDPRPIVLLGGGVGATPLMSMLRHAALSDPQRPVTFLLSVRTDADVPFRAELDALAQSHSRMRIVVAVTRGSASPAFWPGRIDESLLRRFVPSPAEALHFVCGPAPMIAAMRELLTDMGAPPTQVFAEAFEAAVAWAGGARDARPSRDPHAEGGFVEFDRSGTSVAVPAGRTLLDAAEEAGVAIDYSCRSGVCGTCRTRLVSGDVDATADAVDGDVWVLPCVAFPKGHCVIDA